MASSVKARTDKWIDKVLIGALVSAVAILLVGLFSWQIPLGSQIQLRVGEVAPHDVVVPRQITYESQVLTQRARDRAAQNVADQYDSPDGRVRRQQVERSHEILDFITIVRSDEHASSQLQSDYLLAISDLSLTPELALQILTTSPEDLEGDYRRSSVRIGSYYARGNSGHHS